MTDYHYVGTELEIFAHAVNWKNYWAGEIKPFLSGEVLEVGAGTGSNTRLLYSLNPRWVCLEPDPALAAQIPGTLGEGKNSPLCTVKVGTIRDLPSTDRFDSILYIDTLEHIEDDRAEAERAASRLRPGGRLIVLSPAHQWLYSPFDRQIGHFRRYTRSSLEGVIPSSLLREKLIYLDSMGLAASLANRIMLKQSMPTVKQIMMWDRSIIPMSRVADRLLGWNVGKSVVGIWRLGNSASTK